MRGLVFAVAAVAVPLACSSGGPGITDNGDLGQPCHRSEDCANGYCVPRVGET